ncbi:MAG: hypothetical protein WC496_12380 [Phycisphaerae bacterium]|jgi:hypothetical protein
MKKHINISEFVKSNHKNGDIVSFKVSPITESGYSFCCCSGCLREFWDTINDKISPQGPIEHEGSAILNIQNEQVILEQHESGPELIAFLISLAATSVYDFVKWLLLSSISAFKKKGATKIKITKKITTTKQKIVNESTFEIDFNSIKSAKEIDKIIDSFLK